MAGYRAAQSEDHLVTILSVPDPGLERTSSGSSISKDPGSTGSNASLDESKKLFSSGSNVSTETRKHWFECLSGMHLSASTTYVAITEPCFKYWLYS